MPLPLAEGEVWPAAQAQAPAVEPAAEQEDRVRLVRLNYDEQTGRYRVPIFPRNLQAYRAQEREW